MTTLTISNSSKLVALISRISAALLHVVMFLLNWTQAADGGGPSLGLEEDDPPDDPATDLDLNGRLYRDWAPYGLAGALAGALA